MPNVQPHWALLTEPAILKLPAVLEACELLLLALPGQVLVAVQLLLPDLVTAQKTWCCCLPKAVSVAV